MEYTELLFQGDYLIKQAQREFKDRMVAASFTAWQTLSANVEKGPSWDRYIKALGLVDKVNISEDELKNEERQTLNKVERWIKDAQEKAAKNGA